MSKGLGNKLDTFSLLDKNEKTFNHIKQYYEALENGLNPFSIDMLLQKEALSEHLKRCHKEQDMQEINQWISDNAAKFRCYINSMKTLALFLYCDNRINFRKGLVWEIFCSYIDLYNKEKSIIMDTIRLDV